MEKWHVPVDNTRANKDVTSRSGARSWFSARFLGVARRLKANNCKRSGDCERVDEMRRDTDGDFLTEGGTAVSLEERMIHLLEARGSLSSVSARELVQGRDLDGAEAESLSICQSVSGVRAREVRGGYPLQVMSAMCLAEIASTQGLKKETWGALREITLEPGGVYLGTDTVSLFRAQSFLEDGTLREEALMMIGRWEQRDAKAPLEARLNGSFHAMMDVNKVVVLYPEYWYRATSAVTSSSRTKVNLVKDYLTPEHSVILNAGQWAELAEYSPILLKNPGPMTNREKAQIAATGAEVVRAAIFSNLGRRG